MRYINLISSFLNLLPKDLGYWKFLSKYIVAAINTKRFHSLKATEIIIVHDNSITQISIIYGYHWLIYLLLLCLIWILRFFVFNLRTVTILLSDLKWAFSEFRLLILIICDMPSVVKVTRSWAWLTAPHVLSMSAILDLLLIVY